MLQHERIVFYWYIEWYTVLVLYRKKAIQFLLTNCGKAAPIRGYLRPYFEAQPKNKHPSEPPRYISELTHDFSTTVNGPVGSGVFSDSRTKRLADGHPNTAPNPICKMLTK